MNKKGVHRDSGALAPPGGGCRIGAAAGRRREGFGAGQARPPSPGKRSKATLPFEVLTMTSRSRPTLNGTSRLAVSPSVRAPPSPPPPPWWWWWCLALDGRPYPVLPTSSSRWRKRYIGEGCDTELQASREEGRGGSGGVRRNSRRRRSTGGRYRPVWYRPGVGGGESDAGLGAAGAEDEALVGAGACKNEPVSFSK
jgi:hypothetical protein